MNSKQRRQARTERELLWAGRLAKGIERRAEADVAAAREQIYVLAREREAARGQIMALEHGREHMERDAARLACEMEALRMSNHTLQGAIAARDRTIDDMIVYARRKSDRVDELEAHVDHLQSDARSPDKLVRIAAAKQRDLDAAQARIRDLEWLLAQAALPADIGEKFSGVPLGLLLGARR